MSLLAAYNFDEASGNALDVTGNGHGFALAGATIRTASGSGHTDKGLTQSTTSTDAGPNIFGQTSSRTLMCWAKLTGSISAGWVMEFNNTSAGTGVWGFLYLGGVLQLRAKNASNAETHVALANQLADSTWHHLCGSYDGTTLRFFVDGATPTTTAFAGPIWTAADTIKIFDTVGSVLTIDDVRVFDHAMTTTAEVISYRDTPVSASSPARTSDFMPFF